MGDDMDVPIDLGTLLQSLDDLSELDDVNVNAPAAESLPEADSIKLDTSRNIVAPRDDIEMDALEVLNRMPCTHGGYRHGVRGQARVVKRNARQIDESDDELPDVIRDQLRDPASAQMLVAWNARRVKRRHSDRKRLSDQKDEHKTFQDEFNKDYAVRYWELQGITPSPRKKTDSTINLRGGSIVPHF